MLFFSRKKLGIISICLVILLVLLAVLILIGFKKSKNVIITSTLPIKNKVIIIDAGHGYPDSRSLKQ